MLPDLGIVWLAYTLLVGAFPNGGKVERFENEFGERKLVEDGEGYVCD